MDGLRYICCMCYDERGVSDSQSADHQWKEMDARAKLSRDPVVQLSFKGPAKTLPPAQRPIRAANYSDN